MNLFKLECKVIREFKENLEINIKKVDKGIIIVIMNKIDKIKEGMLFIEVKEYYRFFEKLMVEEIVRKVWNIIIEFY